jgi:hypothetical protein
VSTFKWSEVEDIRASIISKMLDTAENISGIMKDPSLLNTWCTFYKRRLTQAISCRTHTEFSEDLVRVHELRQRVNYWKEILETKAIAELLWPMDIDILICSKLLSISILVVYNRKEFARDENKDIKRKDVEDLSKTSAFYSAGNTYLDRPLIVLYRDSHKDRKYVKYTPIILEGNFVNYVLNKLPADIVELIEKHTQKSKV